MGRTVIRGTERPSRADRAGARPDSLVPAFATLGPEEVHVWLFDADALPRPMPPALDPWLTADERARAHAFHHPRDTVRFQARRVARRLLLAAYLRADPNDLVFGSGPQGKPALVAPAVADFSFNASHSGPLVALAVGRGAAIGVDIERLQPLPDAAALAALCCSPAEQASCKAGDAFDGTAFLALWTRKEAFLKYRGWGLIDELAQVEVGGGSTRAPSLCRYEPPGAQPWSATLSTRPVLGGAALLSLATASVTPRIRCILSNPILLDGPQRSGTGSPDPAVR